MKTIRIQIDVGYDPALMPTINFGALVAGWVAQTPMQLQRVEVDLDPPVEEPVKK